MERTLSQTVRVSINRSTVLDAVGERRDLEFYKFSYNNYHFCTVFIVQPIMRVKGLSSSVDKVRYSHFESCLFVPAFTFRFQYVDEIAIVAKQQNVLHVQIA